MYILRSAHIFTGRSGLEDISMMFHPPFQKMRLIKFLSLICGFILLSQAFLCASSAQTGESHGNEIDLVFVIDNSGSMKKNDPDFITPEVVKAFVAQLPELARVGIVLFDEKTRLLNPLTKLSDSLAQQQIISSMGKIDYKGRFTNSPLGIERAIYELKTNGRKDARKGIVFITDGIVDTGSKRKDQELTQWLRQELTAESKDLGIRIFGIAFTEAADFLLIQALAKRTDGEYYRTYDASKISDVLNQIQANLTPPRKSPSPLAKLPLLPEPPEEAIPETTQPVSVSITPSPPELDVKRPEAPRTKFLDYLNIILLLILFTLIGVLAFFYIRSNRRKIGFPQPSQPRLQLPEAHLQDIGKVIGDGSAVIPLNKVKMAIGRNKKNDIVIKQPTMSGFHATIEFKHVAFYLEDQRSTNGTRLNGRKLKPNVPVRLKSGDQITFSRFKFKFNIPSQIPFGDTVMLAMTAMEGPEAGSTIVLDLESDDGQESLVGCLQNHVMQIYGLSSKHREFVNTYLLHGTLETIAAKAHENLRKTEADGEQYCSHFVKNNAFYLVCSLPVPIEAAADWFSSKCNGFTQFIFKWVQSEAFQSAECDVVCIITLGQDPATWVSMTIVPTHEEPDPVEIMSQDFLNADEKAALALDFDNHGRVI